MTTRDYHRTHHLHLTIAVDPYYDEHGNIIGTLNTTVTGAGDGLDFALVELIDAMNDDMYRSLMDALEATGRDL